MLSILMREPSPEPVRSEEAPPPETGDYEIVLGKRQVAGVLFLATVALAVFSAIAYIAGEAMSPRLTAATEPAPVRTVPAAPAKTAPPPAPAPPAPAPVAVKASQAPLFADPKNGELYLQMGAVEKGMAVIFVEGLRTHGFEAFAAPGPNDKIFRVLIGPLADQETYRRTKDAIDDLGLTVFARKYQQ